MGWARYLVVVLLPAIPWVQMRVDQALGGFRAQEEVLYLWSGEQARRVAPGFEGLMADLYWLRTVQYFGSQRLFARDRDFKLLEPLIRLTIALDDRFEIAYRYGAIFLSETGAAGASRPDRGVALMLDAVRRWPGRWQVRQELGYFTYLYLHDHRRAATVLLQAAELPGAPFWLRSMAGDLLTKGGERETARRIWQEMYQRAEDGTIKENARANLDRLLALDVAEAVEKRVSAFHDRLGRLPETLAELVTAGMIPVVPVDPAGVAFDYDPSSGRVSIVRESPLWRAP